MTKIQLDPRIFDTTDDYDKMVRKVHEMAEAARHTLETLSELANETFVEESDIPHFQVVELPSGTSTSQQDLGIIALVPDGEGGFSRTMLDLSFGIQTRPDGFMFPGLQVRTDSRFTKDPESGHLNFRRNPQPDGIMDDTNKLAIDSNIFSWIQQVLPPEQREAFRDLVKSDEDVMLKPKIGFHLPHSQDHSRKTGPALEGA